MINQNNVTIIVPVYNEDLAVDQAISELLEHFPGSEIIIVNDGSTDRTLEKIQRFNVKIISHDVNKGYGAALKSGIKAAAHDTIVTMDADGEHSASSIHGLLRSFDSCVMVVGQRIFYKKENLIRMVGKKVLWQLANFAVGHQIPDINSGLRVFKKSAFQQYLDMLPDTFSFHTTSTLLCIFSKSKIMYVPIETFERKGYSKVDLYSGIVSIKKIFQLTLFLRPIRAFLMVFLPVTLIIPCLFLILNVMTDQTHYLNAARIGFLALFVFVILEILTKSDKNLILTKPFMPRTKANAKKNPSA